MNPYPNLPLFTCPPPIPSCLLTVGKMGLQKCARYFRPLEKWWKDILRASASKRLFSADFAALPTDGDNSLSTLENARKKFTNHSHAITV